MKNLVAVFTVFFLLSQTLFGQKGLEERKWTVDGLERTALVHARPEAKKSETPVVFVFHGHGGTARNAVRTFRIEDYWPEAIVVYPQGVPTPGKLTDPEGKKNGWQHGIGDQGDRDLKFFDAMLKSLKKEYRVNEQAIFSTGHSNGGGFTYTLWGARGDVITAVAPSAAIPAAEVRSKLQPKPVMHIASENDPLVRFTWQKQAIDAVRKLNGVDKVEGQKFGKTITKYEEEGKNRVVTLIAQQQHKFPENAPTSIVKFFKGHVGEGGKPKSRLLEFDE